jgi:hypothetical protein
MLNSTKTFSDWKEFYFSNDIAENKPVDANFGEVFKICSTDLGPAERLEKLCGFQTAAIMVLLRSEGENKPSLEVIHHIQKGAPASAPLSDSDKWYGILGLEKDAPTVEIPFGVIKGTSEAQVPSPDISELFEIQDEDAFIKIGADTSETTPATFWLTPSVPIIPMCISSIQQTKDKTDLATIFNNLSERLSEIVTDNVKNSEDEAEVATIRKICARPLQYLWGATRDVPIESIFTRDIFACASDEVVVARYDRLRAGVFGVKFDQADSSNKRLQWLEAIAQNQNNLNAALAGRGSTLTDSRPSSLWDKLHKTTQQLIQNASTPFYDQGEPVPPTPTGPNAELMTLFNASKDQCKSVLEYALSADRHATMRIDQNLTNKLRSGQFLAFRPGVPHRAGIFYCHGDDAPGETPSVTEEHWDLLLDSRNVSKSDIAAIHSSTIKLAKDHLHLLAQVKNFLAMIDFLFTRKSYIYVATNAWVIAIKQNQSSFSTLCMEQESNVVMIILTIIENRTQLFLKSCSIKKTFSEVESYHLNYSDIIAKLLQREIPAAMIAPCVRAVFNESNKKNAIKRSAQSDDGNANDSSPPKKKKKKTGTKNPDPIPDTWKTSFRNNSNLFQNNINTIPKMAGKSICLKWHGGGSCYHGDDCVRAATHKTMTSATKGEYETWIHKCQNN